MAKLPLRASGLQRGQRFGMAHGAGDAVHHRHRQLTVQRTRQAGERCAREDDHFGAVLGDGAFGQRLQRLRVLFLHAADAGQRAIQRSMLARRLPKP